MKMLRMGGAGGGGRGEGEEKLLVTSGMHNHRPVLTIQAWDPKDQRFKLLQLIPGSYDLSELQEHQQLVTYPGCRHIAIFSWIAAKSAPFEPRQQLSLVVTQPESEHFYLFKYGQAGGRRSCCLNYQK